MAKPETIKVKEKDIVILRFPSEWPVEEKDLVGMMKTIRDAINKDGTIAQRFICLAKGADVDTLSEEQFVDLWKNKFGTQSFEDNMKAIEDEAEAESLISKHLAEHGINQEAFDDNAVGGSTVENWEDNSQDYPYKTEFSGDMSEEEMNQIDKDNMKGDTDNE